MKIDKAKWCSEKNFNDHYIKSELATYAAFVPEFLNQTPPGRDIPLIRAYMKITGNNINSILHDQNALKIIEKQKASLKSKNAKLILIHENPSFRTASYFTACGTVGNLKNVPSIEYAALKQCDEDFDRRACDTLRLRDDFPELVVCLDENTPKCVWQAAEVWRTIDSDLRNLGAFDPSRHIELSLAAYAIATLVLTPWPLNQMIERHSEAALIYGDMPCANLLESQVNGSQMEIEADNLNSESVLPACSTQEVIQSNELSPADIRDDWRSVLERLADLALMAAATEPVLGPGFEELKTLCEEAEHIASKYAESKENAAGERIEQLILVASCLCTGAPEYELTDEDLEVIRVTWREALATSQGASAELNDAIRVAALAATRIAKTLDRLTECRSLQGRDIAPGISAKDKLQLAKQKRELETSIINEIETELAAVLDILHRMSGPEAGLESGPESKEPLPAHGAQIAAFAPPPPSEHPSEPEHEEVQATALIVETIADMIAEPIVETEPVAVTPSEEKPEDSEQEAPSAVPKAVCELIQKPKEEPPAEKPQAIVEEETDGDLLPSSELAGRMLSSSRGVSMSGSIVTSLLAERNYSAAWMASNLARQHGFTPPVDEVLIKALALAPHINYSGGELVDAFGMLVIDDNGLANQDLTYMAADSGVASFFLISACLRAALIAPQTEAAALLSQARPVDADGVYNLVQAVINYGSHQQPLDLRILKNSMTLATWKEEIRKVAESATRWLEEAYTYRIKYIPAIKVWRNWLETGGFVQRAVALIVSGDPSYLGQIDAELKRLTDLSKIDNEIKVTDEALRPSRNSSAMNIDFDAKRVLHAYVAEACNLLLRFKSVVENKPGASERNSFTNKLVDELRDNFRTRLPAARQCLENVIAHKKGLTRVSAETCLAAVEDVAMLFDPNAPTSFSTPSPKHLLYRQALLTPELESGDDWQPFLNDPVKDAGNLLRALLEGRDSIERSYDVAVSLRQHTTTERIIEVLEAEGNTELAEQMRADRSSKLAECRKKMIDRLEEYSKKIGEVFNYGGIDFETFNQAIARLSTMRGSIDTITDFAVCEREIDEMQAKVAERAKAAGDQLFKRLESLSLDPDSLMYRMIQEKLNSNDYAMAEDYLHRAVDGEQLHVEEERPDIFRDFATRRFPLIETYLERTKVVATIISALKTGTLPEDRYDSFDSGPRAAEIYEAYQYAGRKGQFTNEEDVRRALTVLGFDIKSFNQTTDKRVYNLKAKPIIDRSVCPIAMYGSKADGNYRVALFYGTVYENDILTAVNKAPQGGGPLIVLVFGVLKEVNRRKLARICRERAKTFLVIDNTLVYAAATSPLPVLSALFQLAIPWTFYKPYSEGGGAIPPEMFYGRDAEISSITGNGENTYAFIYGGRQLGKTALLDTAARQFNNGANHVAIYIDLVSLGFGKGVALDTFWGVLCRELRNKNVISVNAIACNDGQCLDLVDQWLSEDSSRRVLLFLDEADGFLNEDGKDNFHITGKLKNLKDSTNNRFHIVFSGLHNVKRTTHAKNDPLVQLGNDICVGPMLTTAERRDAARLIEEPMAACGYYFERKELVWRVMFLSMYSPSLIQIFCSKILNHINSNLPAYESQKVGAPPYIITERDVNDAYRTQDIRDDIVYRFNKTITLDDRYEVVACIIANDMLENQGKRNCYDVGWLRAEAQKYWPAGFSQYTGALDRFKVLLKEMEGLGVLFCDEEGNYCFRTSAIATILGTPTAIQERLIKDRTEPVAYTPEIFHPAVDSRDNTVKRAPLAMIDLRAICKPDNAVLVVLGTPASGIGSLVESLNVVAHGQTRFELSSKRKPVGKQFKLADFDEWLAEEMKTRAPGTIIMHVGADVHWDDSWIMVARKKVEKRSSDTQFIKVIFEGRTDNIAYLVEHDKTLPVRNPSEHIFRCLPWHRDMVHLWAADHCNGPRKDNHHTLLHEKTGGWPLLLYKFQDADRLHPGQWKDKLEEICSFRDADIAKECLEAFGFDRSNSYFAPLNIFAVLGEATADDLCELFENADEKEAARKALDWAYLSGLALKERNDLFIINQAVGRLLQAQE